MLAGTTASLILMLSETEMAILQKLNQNGQKMKNCNNTRHLHPTDNSHLLSSITWWSFCAVTQVV